MDLDFQIVSSEILAGKDHSAQIFQAVKSRNEKIDSLLISLIPFVLHAQDVLSIAILYSVYYEPLPIRINSLKVDSTYQKKGNSGHFPYDFDSFSIIAAKTKFNEKNIGSASASLMQAFLSKAMVEKSAQALALDLLEKWLDPSFKSKMRFSEEDLLKLVDGIVFISKRFPDYARLLKRLNEIAVKEVWPKLFLSTKYL